MGVSTFELQRLVSQASVAVANVSYKLVTLICGALVFGNKVGAMGLVGLIIAQGSAMLYVYDRQFGAPAPVLQPRGVMQDVGGGVQEQDLEKAQGVEMIPLTHRGGITATGTVGREGPSSN